MGPFNPNDSLLITANIDLLAPRHLGRGSALDNTGALIQVDWLAGNVRVNGATLFALAEQPSLLDISVDQNNRPIIAYTITAGGFIYYYSPLGAGGYVSEAIGPAAGLAIHNDFKLRGNNIIAVYLSANEAKYRIHAERWATEYSSLNTHKMQSITGFGISQPVPGAKRNTLIVKGQSLEPI